MAIDFSKPALTDNYTSAFVPNLQANQTALARMLDSGVESITGTIPTNTKRYNRSSSAFEEWSGSAWVGLPFQGITLASGNIGMGLTPAFKLDVLAAAASVANFKSSSTSAIIRFADSTADTGYVGSGSALLAGLARTDFGMTAGASGALVLGANNAAQAWLTTTGLGLGGTATGKLDVFTASGRWIVDDNGDGAYVRSNTAAQSLGLSAGGNYGAAQNAAIKLSPGAAPTAAVRLNGGEAARFDTSGLIVGATSRSGIGGGVDQLAVNGSLGVLSQVNANPGVGGTFDIVNRSSGGTIGFYVNGGASLAALISAVGNLGVNGAPNSSVRVHVNASGGNGTGLHVGDVATGLTLYHSATNDPAIIFGSASTLRIGTQTGYGAAGFSELARFNSGSSGPTLQIAATSQPAIRLAQDAGFIEFYNAALTTRSGYLQIQAATASRLMVERNQALEIGTNNLVRLAVAADGRLYGTALHNNAAGINGASQQFIGSVRTSGQSVTGLVNLSSATAGVSRAIRAGLVVKGVVQVSVTASGAGTCRFNIPVPITGASLTSTDDAIGVATANISASSKVVGVVRAAGSGSLLEVEWVSPAAGSYNVNVEYCYDIM